jgi:hypothetical protein
VRPRPVPREIHARNVRAVTTAGACPKAELPGMSAALAAAAALFLNNRRRESEPLLVFIEVL